MTQASLEDLHSVDGGNISKDMVEGIACGVSLAMGEIVGAIFACVIIPLWH